MIKGFFQDSNGKASAKRLMAYLFGISSVVMGFTGAPEYTLYAFLGATLGLLGVSVLEKPRQSVEPSNE